MSITDEQDRYIDDLEFHTYTNKLPNGSAVYSAVAVAGAWGYSVQGFSSNSNPATDPDIQGAFRSFHLLTPAIEDSQSAKTSGFDGSPEQIGRLVGHITFYGLIGGFVILILRSLSGPKKPRRK